MHRLSTYIRVINQIPDRVSVVEENCTESSYLDDGVQIFERETVYQFDNGVEVIQKLEWDSANTENSNNHDTACVDFWLSYEVSKSNGCAIEPAIKQFHNRCQEAFWLKIQP